jgi:hypothetical protein
MAKKQQAIASSELTIENIDQVNPGDFRNAFVDLDIIDNERRLDAIEAYLVDLHKAMGHIGIPRFVPAKSGDNE